MSDWQKEMTQAIGRRVKKLRGKTTVLGLQKRTEELGFRVSRSAISELETGKRNSISVAELLVLAAALEVPPLFLIWDNYPEGEAEMLPDFRVEAFDAHQWASGDFTLRLAENTENDVGELALFNVGTTVRELYKKLLDIRLIHPNILRRDYQTIEEVQELAKRYWEEENEIVRQINLAGGEANLRVEG